MGESFNMYSEMEMKRILNTKIINNPKIYEFVKSHNREQELDFDSDPQLVGGCGAIFGREDYVFLLQLGVPIGIVEYIDSKGNLLIDEDDVPIGDVRHFYKPINRLEEYVEYMEINPFPHVMVNPEYMTKKEVRNLLYCIEHANNDRIFDFDTKNKLQFETINAAPLKYNDAMKIFNKYFNEAIQRKFIYEYGVERDRFYYLSGLKELIPPVKNNHERSER